jgi:hypothetical protein
MAEAAEDQHAVGLLVHFGRHKIAHLAAFRTTALLKPVWVDRKNRATSHPSSASHPSVTAKPP